MKVSPLEALFQQFRAEHDLAALAQVYDRTAPHLLALAKRLSGAGVSPEDLVQETFVVAIEHPTSWDDSRPLTPWLLSILTHRAQATGRSTKRQPDPERLPQREVQRPEELASAAEFQTNLKGAVAGLPAKYREAVKAALMKGQSPSQLAVELGLESGTVRQRLHRGMNLLRMQLKGACLAIAGLLGLRSNSLAAVRETILQRAAGNAPAGTKVAIPIATGGGMARIAGLAALSLLVGTSVWLLWPDSEQSEGPANSIEPATVAAGVSPSAEVRKPTNITATLTPVASGSDSHTSRTPLAEVEEAPLGGSMTGQVLDENSAPVPFATVEAWNSNSCKGPAQRTTRADEEGRFRINHLGPYFAMLAHSKTHAGSQGLRGTLQPEQLLTGNILHVRPKGTMVGVVRNPNGDPAPGAEVTIEHGTGSYTQTQETRHVGITHFDAGQGEAVTDEQGRFRIEGLPEGRHGVSAKLFPYNKTTIASQLAPKEAHIVLQAGLTWNGRIENTAGKPIEGAEVAYWPHYGNLQTVPYWTATDKDGRFSLTGVLRKRDPKRGLVVRAKGYRLHAQQPIPEGADEGEPMLFQLYPEKSIFGSVVDDKGLGVAGIPVRIQGDRVVDQEVIWKYPHTWEKMADRHLGETDANGNFAFDELYDGTFEVFVSEGQKPGQIITKRTRPGADPLKFLLGEQASKGVVLMVTAIDAITGEDLPDARMYHSEENNPNVMQVLPTDVHQTENGIVLRGTGLKEGEWKLQVGATGYSSVNIPIRHYAAGAHELEVTLDPQRSLSLLLLNQDDQPIKGATVTVIRADDGILAAERTQRTSSRQGLMHIHNLQATKVRIEVRTNNAEGSSQVDLTSSQDAPLTVRLTGFQTVSQQIFLWEVGSQAGAAKFQKAWEKMLKNPGPENVKTMKALATEVKLASPSTAFTAKILPAGPQAIVTVRFLVDVVGPDSAPGDPFQNLIETSTQRGEMQMVSSVAFAPDPASPLPEPISLGFKVPEGAYDLMIEGEHWVELNLPLQTVPGDEGAPPKIVLLAAKN